jgi:4-carboxymuconolactone decarboxylase
MRSRALARFAPRQEGLRRIDRAAQQKFDGRGIMDVIGLIGYYDLVSMTLITMQAEAPNNSVLRLRPLAAR